jgi:hypothetical protein
LSDENRPHFSTSDKVENRLFIEKTCSRVSSTK